MKRLITISREYGSGGRLIGAMVAEKMGIPVYDKELIDMAVEHSGLDRDIIETAELRAKNSFSYSFASAMAVGEGFSADAVSINEKLYMAQSDVIRQIAEIGDGVIIGRCADYVLRDIPEVTNVFIYANMEDRINRCINSYGDDPDSVQKKIKNYDKARANYYNYHTAQKWGNYRNYNLAINSSHIPDEAIANLIVEFVHSRDYKG